MYQRGPRDSPSLGRQPTPEHRGGRENGAQCSRAAAPGAHPPPWASSLDRCRGAPRCARPCSTVPQVPTASPSRLLDASPASDASVLSLEGTEQDSVPSKVPSVEAVMDFDVVKRVGTERSGVTLDPKEVDTEFANLSDDEEGVGQTEDEDVVVIED